MKDCAASLSVTAQLLAINYTENAATDSASEFRVLRLESCCLCRQALDAVKMVRLSATRGRHLRHHVNISRLHVRQVSLKSATHVQRLHAKWS